MRERRTAELGTVCAVLFFRFCLGSIDDTADRWLQVENRIVRSNEPVWMTLDCELGWQKPGQLDLCSYPGTVDA